MTSDSYKYAFTSASTAHLVAERIGCKAYRTGDVWRLSTSRKSAHKQRYNRAEQKQTAQRIIDKVLSI